MKAIRYLLPIIATFSTAQLARAFEPFSVQNEPKEIRALDHFEPVNHAVPEFRYLAQYWAKSQYEGQRYVVVVKDESTGRCYVEQGDPPKGERILYRPYRFKTRAEISSETATIIHELWANALLQTHYDRKGLSVVVTNTTECTFSTFVWNLGWMHGRMSYPAVRDLPPSWMYGAGEALFTFVTASHDETALRAKIRSTRDRFYEYAQTHERSNGN
jgi:hypothetical protein